MINIKNIKKVYGSKNSKKVALNNINIKISEGEIIGLLGSNGAGKTTLTKVICGLIIPDEGEVEVLGWRLDNTNQRRIMNKIGVVLEGARNLYWRVTAKDNYYYFGYLKGKNRKEIENNIKKYSDALHTNNLLNRVVKNLSLGEKQKVAITACLLHEPKIILLDEPSNGLDIESRVTLQHTLKYINSTYKTTIIVTSHDISFLNNIVDRYIIINNGQVKDIFSKSNLNIKDIENKYKYSMDLSKESEGIYDDLF